MSDKDSAWNIALEEICRTSQVHIEDIEERIGRDCSQETIHDSLLKMRDKGWLTPTPGDEPVWYFGPKAELLMNIDEEHDPKSETDSPRDTARSLWDRLRGIIGR